MRAEPISLAVGWALFSAGAGHAITVAGMALATSLVTLAPVALSIGLQAVAQSRLRKSLAAVNDDRALQQIIKQAIPPQRLPVGRAASAGATFFYEAKPPYMWIGLLLAADECGEFENMLVQGHEVRFGSDGIATTTPYRDGSNEYLEVSYRNGSIDQAIDPIIARDFPSMPTTFRQRGHATMVIKAHYGFGANRQAQDDDHLDKYGATGRFTPIIRFQGVKMYDPRDPGQVLTDKTTWRWSDNAALCAMRWLTHQWPDTQILEPERVNWDRIGDAANICDAWDIGANGMTFRRHTANGVITTADDTYDVVEHLRTAFGGHLVMDRGKIYPVPRYKRDPVATLHLDMVRGGIEYTAEPRDRETANIVRTQFVSPDREYQTVTGPVLRDAAAITADGKPREITLLGALVEDHRRIQRKAKNQLKLARAGRGLACGSTLEAFEWNIGDPIRVDFPADTVFAAYNGIYELVEKAWDDGINGLRLSLSEWITDIDDFDPSEEQDFTVDEDTITAEAA